MADQAAGAEEEEISAELRHGGKRVTANAGAEVADISATEHDHLDQRKIRESRCDAERIGSHGQLDIARDCPGDRLIRRTTVDEQAHQLPVDVPAAASALDDLLPEIAALREAQSVE